MVYEPKLKRCFSPLKHAVLVTVGGCDGHVGSMKTQKPRPKSIRPHWTERMTIHVSIGGNGSSGQMLAPGATLPFTDEHIESHANTTLAVKWTVTSISKTVAKMQFIISAPNGRKFVSDISVFEDSEPIVLLSEDQSTVVVTVNSS